MKSLKLTLIVLLVFIAINAYSQAQKKYNQKISKHEQASMVLTSLEQLISENTETLALLSKTTDSLYRLLSQMTKEGVDSNYIRRRYQSQQLLNLEAQLLSIQKITALLKGGNPQETHLADNKKATEQSDSKQSSERFFTDTRDGRTYRIVEIGEQLWMVENLTFASGGSEWCYSNTVSHCHKYGRLYDWQAAKSACPRGWKLPTKGDFETLFNTLGGDGNKAFNALIEGGETGFNALLGGWGDINGNYDGLGTFGVWWSASEQSNTHAWSMDMGIGIRDAGIDVNNKSTGLSVRCMRNVLLTQSR